MMIEYAKLLILVLIILGLFGVWFFGALSESEKSTMLNIFMILASNSVTYFFGTSSKLDDRKKDKKEDTISELSTSK